MEKSKFARIYVLLRNEIVFYVGETTKEENRFRAHKIRFGDDIEMHLLEEVLYSSRLWWESYYIDLFKSWGFVLKNKHKNSFSKSPFKNELKLLEKYKLSEVTETVILNLKSSIKELTKENELLKTEADLMKCFLEGNIYAVKLGILSIAIEEFRLAKTPADIESATKELNKLRKHYFDLAQNYNPANKHDMIELFRRIY